MQIEPDFAGKPLGAAVDWMVKGDKEAYTFVTVMFAVLHLWDDAIDGDKPADINNMMFGAMVVLPRDPFYQRHFNLLSPLLEMAILNWQAANTLEQTENLADKRIAFITRSDYLNIALMAARIVGGWEWANEIAPHARRFCHAEGFDTYLDNLRAQFAAAGTKE